MKANEIKERIEKKEATIEKKRGTITKKFNAIAKKEAGIRDLKSDIEAGKAYAGRDLEREIRWLGYDIVNLNDDIERLYKEIAVAEATIAKYEEQLKKAIKAEATYNEVPECLKEFEKATAEKWNAFDKMMRDEYREALREHREQIKGLKGEEYREADRAFYVEYRDHPGRHIVWTSDADIEKDNADSAHRLVMNLVKRCKKIAGEITDWSGLRVEAGNNGWLEITGFVYGTEGNAEVFTILAGGYNIQRLHVRTLVKAR